MENIFLRPSFLAPTSIRQKKLGIYRLMHEELNSETRDSLSVWDNLYKEKENNTEHIALQQKIALRELPMLGYINSKIGRSLEIGCGLSMMNMELARLGWETWGVDFSFENLVGAVKYWKKHKVKGHFVEGDILHMPFKDNTFDLVFGRGVIEHFRDTLPVIDELFRVTKKGGRVINTVPALTISSLTYRQLSGTIPEFPLLKPLFEKIHINMLKKRFMHCGYEKSFTKDYLKKIHLKAGFRQVSVTRMQEFKGQYKGAPDWLKNILWFMETLPPFIPWYKIEAIK